MKSLLIILSSILLLNLKIYKQEPKTFNSITRIRSTVTSPQARIYKNDFIDSVKGYDSIINGKILMKDLYDYYQNHYENKYKGIRVYNAYKLENNIKSIYHIISVGDVNEDDYSGAVLILNDSGTVDSLTDTTEIKQLIRNFYLNNITVSNQTYLKSSTWYSWTEFETFRLSNPNYDINQVYYKFTFGLNKRDFAKKYFGINCIINAVDVKNNDLSNPASIGYTNGRFDVGDPCPNNCGSYDPTQ